MKKTAHILARQGAEHQQSWGGAFAEGLRLHGWQVEISDHYQRADLVVLWGVRRQEIISDVLNCGGEVCILERGYLGDRFHWTSVSFGGGLNGRGRFFGPLSDRSRFERHFGQCLRAYDVPYGGPALIMGQVVGDMSVRHVQIEKWYDDVSRELKELGWDVRFRPHPYPRAVGGSGGGAGLKKMDGTLHEALAAASFVVTYNSNSGVDALLYGRPTVAVDAGSMVWGIAGRTTDDVRMPDRSAWAARLAWCQWSDAEMRSGECWAAISENGGPSG